MNFWLRHSLVWCPTVNVVSKGVVYIDGSCSYCRTTGRAIERFDWLHNLEVRDFRRDQSYRDSGISDSDLEAEIHLVSGAEVLRGYDAILRVLARTPMGMLAWPFACLAKSVGLGPWAYRRLAERRPLAHSSANCRDQVPRVK